MAVVTPLYGHTNEETAYVVQDYPYGYKLRCVIRYWLEHDEKRGYRFVSQTKNPKTDRWNAPKKSTYCCMAGAMFLDENGHVQWTGIGTYPDLAKVEDFCKNFPQSETVETMRRLADLIRKRESAKK